MSAEEFPVVNVQEKEVAPEPLSARVLAVVLAAGGFTVVITILDRILGGGWRSWGSMTSSFLLASYALVPPLGFTAASEREKQSWGTGAMAGAAVGLVYGLAVRSILPGAFFGACIGAGSAGLAARWLKKDAKEVTFGAVAVGLVLAWTTGLLTPTRLVQKGNAAKAESTASNDGSSDSKSSAISKKVLGKQLTAKQMAKVVIQGKKIELGMSKKRVFAILGTPTEVTHTDFSKNADFIRRFQNMTDRAEGRTDRSVRVPDPMDQYSWTSKDAGFVLVALENDEVISVMVNEGKGNTTFQLDRPFQR